MTINQNSTFFSVFFSKLIVKSGAIKRIEVARAEIVKIKTNKKEALRAFDLFINQRLQLILNRLNRLTKIEAKLHLFFNFIAGMNNGGVVFSTEKLTNVFQAKARVFAN